MKYEAKARNWCFTLFKDPDEGLFFDDEKISYVTYQGEKCPSTGKLHWQGYVEFKNVMRRRECQRALGEKKCHVEPRKGTQKQAIDYCHKLDTRVGVQFEWGKPKQQGHCSHLDSIWEAVKGGATKLEILNEFGGTAMRYLHFIRQAQECVHELDILDKYILERRSLKKLKNASEVEGNTEPPLRGETDSKTRSKIIKDYLKGDIDYGGKYKVERPIRN